MSDFHHIRQLDHNLGHSRRNRGGGGGGAIAPSPSSKGGGDNYMVLPPPILGHNLQFSGKFAEIPFFSFSFFPRNFQESCRLTQNFVRPPMI